VVAALTILRAFVVANRPAHAWPPKGSFDAWSELVRGAIAHAGGEDPLGGVRRIRDQGDEDLDKLRALLCAWHDKYKGIVATVSQAIQDAGKSGDLHNALVAYCRSGQLEGKPIGNALRKVRGRPANKLVLERMGEDRKGIALWRVVSTERARSAGSAGSAGSLPCPTGCPEVTDSAGSGE
jgi:putative DNA primase/helicase